MGRPRKPTTIAEKNAEGRLKKISGSKTEKLIALRALREYITLHKGKTIRTTVFQEVNSEISSQLRKIMNRGRAPSGAVLGKIKEKRYSQEMTLTHKEQELKTRLRAINRQVTAFKGKGTTAKKRASELLSEISDIYEIVKELGISAPEKLENLNKRMVNKFLKA